MNFHFQMHGKRSFNDGRVIWEVGSSSSILGGKRIKSGNRIDGKQFLRGFRTTDDRGHHRTECKEEEEEDTEIARLRKKESQKTDNGFTADFSTKDEERRCPRKTSAEVARHSVRTTGIFEEGSSRRFCLEVFTRRSDSTGSDRLHTCDDPGRSFCSGVRPRLLLPDLRLSDAWDCGRNRGNRGETEIADAPRDSEGILDSAAVLSDLGEWRRGDVHRRGRIAPLEWRKERGVGKSHSTRKGPRDRQGTLDRSGSKGGDGCRALKAVPQEVTADSDTGTTDEPRTEGRRTTVRKDEKGSTDANAQVGDPRGRKRGGDDQIQGIRDTITATDRREVTEIENGETRRPVPATSAPITSITTATTSTTDATTATTTASDPSATRRNSDQARHATGPQEPAPKSRERNNGNGDRKSRIRRFSEASIHPGAAPAGARRRQEELRSRPDSRAEIRRRGDHRRFKRRRPRGRDAQVPGSDLANRTRPVPDGRSRRDGQGIAPATRSDAHSEPR